MPTFKNEVNKANQVAIVGLSKKFHGVTGESGADGAGIIGISDSGEGVSGFSTSGNGVVGQSDAACGVRGLGKTGRGVEGLSEQGEGVRGVSDSGIGVWAESHSSNGLVAQSESGSAVRAVSKSGRGVEGWSESAYGVSGDSQTSAGVRGTSREGRGVEGWSTRSEGVVGISDTGTGVWGVAGRSPYFGKFGDVVGSTVFDSASAAKRFAVAAKETRPPIPEPDPASSATPNLQALAVMVPPTAVTPAPASPSPSPSPFAGVTSDVAHANTDVGVAHVTPVFDDTAGIGVCGEHRGGGIGVKAQSRSGMGLAAYSAGHEAVHAETQSPQTAAIAAYNLNARGTGAALFAKKTGPHGHAGFFDGRVWIGGELGVGGDILLANADCAEDFDVIDLGLAEPGSVMVIGDDGVLHPCATAYDKRVAGVISGAGQYKPGLILDKQAGVADRSPVALLGKVCCKVTADAGAIEIGDLLTTSAVPGHAMKASDAARAFGAVIGKALRPLRAGSGLIPILIALQ
ncbi:MAG TPA: hypothetical protein VJP84_04050 [Steroidobacteraceae bacterium]|nr:hypothetical protein [Steroidobacteraceae bacterium]